LHGWWIDLSKEAILMKQAGEVNGRTKKGGKPEVQNAI